MNQSECKLLNEAKKYYEFSNLNYHNTSHVDSVINRLRSIGREQPSLLLAAAYHDAIYIPGAPLGMNEQMSALVLLNEWKKLGSVVDEGVILAAKIYIEKTTVTHHLQWVDPATVDTNYNYLMDADLGSLASDYETFKKIQSEIIKENFGDPLSKDSLKKSAAFLKQFLDNRHYIYRTIDFRDMWEVKAKNNIEKYIKEVNEH